MKLVALGGGTGLSTLLRGLKRYVPATGCTEIGLDNWLDQLTAVVTVTDDGGSSGQLRKELQVLPPGDIRNCMVALAEDEALMTQLFKYRFQGDGNLHGHSFGNLFLTAMSNVVGDFMEAIRLASEVLNIRGRIFPATTDDVCLTARLANGQFVTGETEIVKANLDSEIDELALSPTAPVALPEAVQAILEADIITIGPGSLFTSILPNLLVPGIAEALAVSKAQKIFICNVMTQPGETGGFSVADHLRIVQQYAPQLHFDYMLVNATPLTAEQYAHHAARGVYPVREADAGPCKTEMIRCANNRLMTVYYCDLLDEQNPVRHDSTKLALTIKNMSQPVPVSEVLRLAA